MLCACHSYREIQIGAMFLLVSYSDPCGGRRVSLASGSGGRLQRISNVGKKWPNRKQNWSLRRLLYPVLKTAITRTMAYSHRQACRTTNCFDGVCVHPKPTHGVSTKRAQFSYTLFYAKPLASKSAVINLHSQQVMYRKQKNPDAHNSQPPHTT